MSCQSTADPKAYIASHMAPTLYSSMTNTVAYRASFARFKTLYGKKMASVSNIDCITIAPTPIFPPGLCPPQYLSIPNEKSPIDEAFENKVRSVRSIMKSHQSTPAARTTPVSGPGAFVSTSTYRGISIKKPTTTSSITTSAPENARATVSTTVPSKSLDCVIIPANPCRLTSTKQFLAFSSKDKPTSKKPRLQSHLTVAVTTQDTKSTTEIKVLEKSNAVVVDETPLHFEINSEEQVSTQTFKEVLSADIKAAVQEEHPLDNGYNPQQEEPTDSQAHAANQTSMALERSNNHNNSAKESPIILSDDSAIEMIAAQGDDVIDAETSIPKTMDLFEAIAKECTVTEKVIAESPLEAEHAVANEYLLVDSTKKDIGLATPVVNSLQEIKTSEDQLPTEDTTRIKQYTVLKYEPMVSGHICVQGERMLHEETNRGSIPNTKVSVEQNVALKNELNFEDNTVLTDAPATGDSAAPDCISAISETVSPNQLIIELPVGQSVSTHEDTAIQSKIATDTRTSAGNETTINNTTENHIVHINQDPAEAYPSSKNSTTNLDTAFASEIPTNKHTNAKVQSITTSTDAFSNPHCEESLILGQVPVDINFSSEGLVLENESATARECSIKESGPLSAEMADVKNAGTIDVHPKTISTTAVPKRLARASDFKDWLAKMKSPKVSDLGIDAANDADIPQSQQATQFSKQTISTRTEAVVDFEAVPEAVMADPIVSPDPLDKTYIPIGKVEPGEANLTKPLQHMTLDTVGAQDPQTYPLRMINDPISSQPRGFSANRPQGGGVNDTTATEFVSPPNVTVVPRSQSVSSNSSRGSGSKARPLATAKDFEAYMQATSVFAAKNVVAGSGVFLMTKEARIELPEKYLQCMATNCQYLTCRQKCNGSHHKRCPGATPSILRICTSFVKFGICATKGASCAHGVHPCPTQSRFNTCNNSNCSYLHEVSIDQFGQALLTMRELSILPSVNDLTSLSLINSVERRFDLEPPGTGTELGPRNDNDWRDYTKLSVLPTIDEIIPGRSTVYMPHKKMMFPLSQVLDVGFRHQREAMLGPVRDSVADAIRRIIKGDHLDTDVAEGSKIKYRVYPNAKFGQASVEGGRQAVATFSISFPSPGHGFLKIDKVLRIGHLLAILIHSENGFLVIWAKAMEDWSDRDEEGKCSKIGHISIAIVDEKTSERDLGTILRLRSTQKEFYLIDFAGVLPDAFMNGLFVLQEMGGKTLPFARDLFERQIGESMFNIPHYLRHRMINLSSLGYHETYNCMSALRAGKRWSTLMKDQLAQENSEGMSFTGGQADAIINTLSSALSCIQGPPGTGKTFIGCAIVKLLAVNRRSWSGKQTIPILLTAQTNHALDETIAAYIKCGLKVARLGIAHGKESPEPEHVQYQHHILPRGQQDICRKACNSAYKNREDAARALENFLEDVSKESLSWFRVGPYLQENHIEFFQAFIKASGGGHAADGFNFWVNNKDMDEESSLLTGLKQTIPEGLNIQTPPLEERVPSISTQSSTQKSPTCTTDEIDPWRLTAKQRKVLIDNWKSTLNKSLDANVLAARATLQKCKDIYEKALAAETAAKMVDFGVDVVACTATRAAKDHHLLKRLGIEVVVVEEAGEVVESIVLPIFLSSIQHVILIGDHQQLKPYCDNKGLTGGNYNHDKSLFERLVTPNTEGAPSTARLACLDCQRRMRPEIADLVRCLGLYDKLSDGSNVQRYPDVPGMGGRNLLWVDHKHPESMSLDRSYENSYEAVMVAGHAAHLFRSGEFGIRDLVIITPYRAQVKAINSALAKEGSFTIPVPATDMDLLSQRNSAYRRLLESAEETTMVGVSISDAVLVTTVDNYQGEEANVIFYSAVRSNQNGRVGFTDISNRICVTLSRARHGMYIFGNAETAREGGKWWNKAVNHMQQRGLVTDGVPLELCNRHPTQTQFVKDPSSFQRSNSCDMSCTTTLACGHICNRRCHPEAMHSLPHFQCISACDLSLGCGHKCGGICGSPCRDCLECKNSAERNDSDHKPEVRKKRLVFEMCQHDLVRADCSLCLGQDIVSNHNDWYFEFSRLYSSRARSLSEGKENDVAERKIFLRSLNLSRSGLSDNIYRFGVRMSIFSGFEAAFRSGLEQAKEIEGKFGYPGLVKRIEGVKAYVNRAVEDDYSWFYKELVGLSASGNSAGMFAKVLRKAVAEVLQIR